MSELTLPKQVVKAARKSPKNMIIYGPPKIGKTTALSQLENCLIIDLEDGSDMVDALKIKVNNLAELAQVGKAIISEESRTSTLPSILLLNWRCGVSRTLSLCIKPHPWVRTSTRTTRGCLC